MARTILSIHGDRFHINGRPTYSDIPGSNPASHGLLWNQRMIQGVFDDAGHRELYGRNGRGEFDPERNTDALIASLAQWKEYGMLAFTVGFQGGWPVGMTDVKEIKNNPFGLDGKQLDAVYAARMDRIIRAADELGMVVIVNFLYWAQTLSMQDGRALASAVRAGSRFLKEGGYRNVIIDVANEYDIPSFTPHPLINSPEGIAQLMQIAREESGGLPVGSSGCSTMHREAAEESDVVLVHGNGLSRGQYYDFLRKVRSWAPDKPILCNEDSPCVTRMDVSLDFGVSWGCYNNYTKQIPPADWSVTPGEDLYFARRIAAAVGIPQTPLAEEQRYMLQGIGDSEAFGGGLHVMRLAAERPEDIERVEFYCGGDKMYTSYDEPFYCYRETTWSAKPFIKEKGKVYRAEVYLHDGRQLSVTSHTGKE